MNRPGPVVGLAAAWTLASTADNFVMFVLLWIAGPQGWSGAQTATSDTPAVFALPWSLKFR